MKKILILLLVVISLHAAAQQDSLTIDPALQKKYLVSETGTAYIGMPAEQLPAATMKKDILDNYVKKYTKGNVKQITFQVTTGNPQVYEFIIEYSPGFNLTAFMTKKYGTPNSSDGIGNVWLVPLADGLKLRIWKYKNKLCIADARQFPE